MNKTEYNKQLKEAFKDNLVKQNRETYVKTERDRNRRPVKDKKLNVNEIDFRMV